MCAAYRVVASSGMLIATTTQYIPSRREDDMARVAESGAAKGFVTGCAAMVHRSGRVRSVIRSRRAQLSYQERSKRPSAEQTHCEECVVYEQKAGLDG